MLNIKHYPESRTYVPLPDESPQPVSNFNRIKNVCLEILHTLGLIFKKALISFKKTLIFFKEELISLKEELISLDYFFLRQSFFPSTREFNREMDNWLKHDGTDNEKNKKIAAQRIIGCYFNRHSKLSLNSLKLSTLPSCIGKLSNLRELNLSSNQLTSVPPVIGTLSNLKSLDIGDNQLTSISPEIGTLSNLKRLNVRRNQLTSIPPEIGTLSNLESLNVEHNQLTSIPPEIGTLSNLESLNVQHNQLTSIPPEIGTLSNLESLNVEHNQLTSIPPEIGTLSNLKSLLLENNQLTSIPPEIGTLSNLTFLFLEKNQLTSLPPEIGTLSNLTFLSLAANQLAFIPIEVGQLINLNDIHLDGNPELNELPLCLGELANLFTITTEGTAIPYEHIGSILASCRTKRAGENTYLPRVGKWLAAAGSQKDIKDFDHFEMNEKAIFDEWLRRLEQTKDYRNSQKRVALLICDLLETAVKDQEFKALFLSQAEVDNKFCEDRAAMSLNIVYTFWRLHTLPSQTPLKEKLNLLIRGAKTHALRRILSQKINDYGIKNCTKRRESVETFLYYETQLKAKCHLLTAIDRMAYEEIGRCSWIDLTTLESEIEESYVADLIGIPGFQNLIQQDQDFKTSLDCLEEQYHQKIEELNSPPDDECSEEYINWQRLNHEIMEKLKQEKIQATKNWLKTHPTLYK